jgi:hypothetical protein
MGVDPFQCILAVFGEARVESTLGKAPEHQIPVHRVIVYNKQ